MKIYLSDSLKNVENTRKVAKRLEEQGHKIVSSWVFENYGETLQDPLTDRNLCEKISEQNLVDMRKANIFVFFPATGSSPGKNVEFGYMMKTKGVLVVVVGKFTSVFHSIADVFFTEEEELFKWLGEHA